MRTHTSGIDYSNGRSNRSGGYHYGVIPCHDLAPWIYDEIDPVYVARCPHCGDDLDKSFDCDDEDHNSCVVCGMTLIESDFDDQSADYYTLNDPDYDAAVAFDSDSDLFITRSPYFTRAQFCSPCAPGAGYLRNPCDTGPKTFCLGHEYFVNGVAPYPVYRVGDDSGNEVYPVGLNH